MENESTLDDTTIETAIETSAIETSAIGSANDTVETVETVDELLIEEISIDGMCGVY